MFRTAIFVSAMLCMFVSEAVSKSAESAEDQRIAKFGDKVSQQGDELLLRLKDGRVIPKKSAAVWYGPFDCDGNTNISYTFHDFVDPWFIVYEHYYESAGTSFINWETGLEEHVSGSSIFSPERTRFFTVGYGGEGEYDVEMWKVTPEGVVREWVLYHGISFDLRWLDPTAVEIADNDFEVAARVTRNGASWKCLGAVGACNALKMSKSTGNSAGEVARERDLKIDDRSIRDTIDRDIMRGLMSQPKEGLRVDPETGRLVRVHIDDEDSAKSAEPTLISAARKGDVEAVKSLLDRGSPIDATDENGRTALEAAAARGRSNVVKFLLSRGARPNSKEYLNPPIMYAAERGDADTVKILLDNGADPNAPGANARTALMASVARGHLEVVRLLLEKGADPNARDAYGSTALTVRGNYRWMGTPQIIKLLLDRGADPNAQHKDGKSALQSAAGQGDLEMIKPLLDNGADVNIALKEAVFRKQPSAVKLLLDRGAEPSRAFESYDPCLEQAQDKSRCVSEIVKILLENGSEVNLPDKNGLTGLMVAAGRGYPDIVKRLLDRGADVNAKDTHGWNALAWAAQAGHKDIAALLKKHGAEMTLMAAACLPDMPEVQRSLRNGSDVNAKGVNGRTALMGAAELGHSDVVKLLLDKGADANAEDENEGTALMASAKKGHPEVVKLLLEKAVDLDGTDSSDQTALMMAVRGGHVEVVKLLLKKGADVNIMGDYCRTPLDIAKEVHPSEIEALLRAHGAIE